MKAATGHVQAEFYWKRRWQPRVVRGEKITLLVKRQDIGQKQVGSPQRQEGPGGIRQAARRPKTSWGQSR